MRPFVAVTALWLLAPPASAGDRPAKLPPLEEDAAAPAPSSNFTELDLVVNGSHQDGQPWTVNVRLSESGRASVRYENLTGTLTENMSPQADAPVGGRVANASFSYQLTPAELADMRTALRQADETRTPLTLTSTMRPMTFSLRIQTGTTSRVIAGNTFEYRGMELMKKLASLPPTGRVDATRDLRSGQLIFEFSDGKGFSSQMTLEPGGRVHGHYRSPARGCVTLDGQATAAEQATIRQALLRANFVKQPFDGPPSPVRMSFTTRDGDQSRWISGHGFELRDENLALIARTFSEVGVRLEAEATRSRPAKGMTQRIGEPLGK